MGYTGNGNESVNDVAETGWESCTTGSLAGKGTSGANETWVGKGTSGASETWVGKGTSGANETWAGKGASGANETWVGKGTSGANETWVGKGTSGANETWTGRETLDSGVPVDNRVVVWTEISVGNRGPVRTGMDCASGREKGGCTSSREEDPRRACFAAAKVWLKSSRDYIQEMPEVNQGNKKGKKRWNPNEGGGYTRVPWVDSDAGTFVDSARFY
jgi:hypothetical protein